MRDAEGTRIAIVVYPIVLENGPIEICQIVKVNLYHGILLNGNKMNKVCILKYINLQGFNLKQILLTNTN